MQNKNLRQVINDLTYKFGYQGAYEYISTGEYPYELKRLALSIIKEKEANLESLVINSDYQDIENPWGSSVESLYYAS